MNESAVHSVEISASDSFERDRAIFEQLLPELSFANTMKAIQIKEYGGPEVLTLAEVAAPEPGEGQVRIRVESIGVNFVDVYHRTGSYEGQLPFILGR
jgi:hypothetical protein